MSENTGKNGRYWIDKLDLSKHPDGAYVKETYRAGEVVEKDALPERFTGGRAFSTAIYALFESDHCMYLHCLRADEVWHSYAGSPLTLHIIAPDGNYSRIRLGPDFDAAERARSGSSR